MPKATECEGAYFVAGVANLKGVGVGVAVLAFYTDAGIFVGLGFQSDVGEGGRHGQRQPFHFLRQGLGKTGIMVGHNERKEKVPGGVKENPAAGRANSHIAVAQFFGDLSLFRERDPGRFPAVMA